MSLKYVIKANYELMQTVTLQISLLINQSKRKLTTNSGVSFEHDNNLIYHVNLTKMLRC